MPKTFGIWDGFFFIFSNVQPLLKTTMMRIRAIFVCCLLFLVIINADAQITKQNEFLIQLNERGNIEKFQRKHPFVKVVKCCSEPLRIYLINVDSLQKGNLLLDQLYRDPAIRHLQPNHEIQWRDIPNDPSYSLQSKQFDQIRIQNVWDITTGGLTSDGDTIVVAVIDRGVDYLHEDLNENFWRNHAEIPNDGIDNDLNGYIDDFFGYNFQARNDQHASSNHGTAVAGLIGAIGNNNKGVAGINWNVRIMFLSGATFESEVIEAYSYILDQRKLYNQTNGALGAFIVASNASFGISNAQPEDFPLWCDIYDDLGIAGILNVAATVNGTFNIDETGDMPTGCSTEFLLTVTNVDSNDSLAVAGFSKTSIDIGAPGEHSFSTWSNNNYGTFSGTSGAAPQVSGAIGLLYSLDCPSLLHLAKTNPKQAAYKMKQFILNNARKVKSLEGRTVSEGILDLTETVEQMKLYCEKPNTITPKIFNIFPNPVESTLIVFYDKPTTNQVAFQITDALGQVIDVIETPDFSFSQLKAEIDVSQYRAGIYFLTLQNGGTSTIPFVVVKD